MTAGPLAGIRVVEMEGIGPAPFAAMLLSDMGAEVMRIGRPGGQRQVLDITARGRRLVELDLKQPGDIATCLGAIARADVLIEGFRPGVMERLGLGPEAALARNPGLIYARMTGWGQDGPYAQAAGHDINYIAISGALHAIGEAGAPPIPPLNLIGDLAGGGLHMAMGICAALVERAGSGCGQVIDCAMSDGAASLMTVFYGLHATGNWVDQRGANRLDGGAPFYCAYACSDGKSIAIGPLEPAFYAILRDRLGLNDDPLFDLRGDKAQWPAIRIVALYRRVALAAQRL